MKMGEIRRIGEVLAALGTPEHHQILVSADEPFMQRASWLCGCVIDFVDASCGAFHWAVCDAHDRPSVAPARQGGVPIFFEA